MFAGLPKKITRSVSNISAMRGKNESTMMTPTRGLSEVASAEMSCYGVFRKLESVRGGGERITTGRPPQSRLSVAVQSPPITPVSPRVSAFVYVTAAADDDHDCCNFDRETNSVYGCDAATAVTTSTTATVTTDAASTGGRDDCGLSDFGGAVAWDDYDYCCSAATAVDTTVDLRGGAAAPFSHTPMGSTTKLVGIDANSDDTPKIYCCKSNCLQSFGTLLMTVSLTLSLANVIRLPRMVFLYGGGTFLVSYLAVAIVFGVPLLFLEITLGQFCQQGTTKLWRAVPLLKGVGFVKVLASVLLAAYYPIIMALSLFYGSRSIIGSIPFPECSNSISFYQGVNSNAIGSDQCLQQTFIKPPHLSWQWIAMDVLLILLIWIIVVISLIKNSKSYRTVALLVVPATFVTIGVLLVKGLNANQRGLDILLDIQWETLWKLDIWYHAIVQFLFTTHLGFGNITTSAGRLYSKSNPFWTSVMLTVVSIVVGLCSVSIVTMWIYDMQLQVGQKMLSSTALSEVWFLTFVYELTTRGILSDLWAALVYALVFLSGFLSLIAAIYTAIVGLSVETKEKWKWWILTCMVCFIAFLMGVLCLLPENLQAVHLLDEYIIGRMVVTSTVLELIAFVWIYGLESLSNDFEFVLGYKLCFVWKCVWLGTPILFMGFEFWSLFVMPLTESDYSSHDSMWLYVIGWIVYLFMWSMIIGIAVWQISAQVDYNFSQKFLSTIKPARNWGPVDPIYRHCWVQWKKQYQVTGERDFTLRRRGTKDYTHSIKRGKHAAPPGTAYSVSPTSLDRTSSCYSIDGVGGLSRQHSSDQQSQQQQQQKNLHQYHYNHTMADQRRWTAAEPKNSGGSSINYM
ncbi:sodium-dependent nutrient amino acid transporter 1 isoform X2 [Acyrthosiphon pisum]|uniref:Sodium-dependent nutrient amino acid transporter 1 n=1 Tax=Acyrthosiphon pisum TaxID=7029 RepID=A0A8R2H212_ACYPI|nr:sodium-dependent nutrient amino acid transporter 1 isoform X2 [Acyrthosiphon pisum]|eukprot:XP_016655699.1 PREDICTED: sodium-dependent nutrient amino acid transporter 1 isoform X2 [Acyrthosiphon pisum]